MLKQSPRYPYVLVLTAGLMLTGWCASAFAQSQSDNAPSVAEAARRAREQKKNSAKPVRTLTNDNLPAAPAPGANDTGSAATRASAAADQTTPATTEAGAPVNNADAALAAPAAAPASEEQAKQKKAENVAKLEHAKKELAQAQGELDVMQRKAVLDSDSFYSKTGFANDKDGKAVLDSEAQQINEKKQAIEALKAKIAELQAVVDQSATPPDDKDKPQP